MSRGGAREPSLSIGDVADRTGVSPATLRTWEARYGFPTSLRLAGGHRRYAPSTVDEIGAVLGYRAQGLHMDAAIAHVRTRASSGHRSLLAGLRATRPALRSQVLTKKTILALTRALEDETCARADDALLFATFQEQRFYDRARLRYDDLAGSVEQVVVFADFPRHGPVDRPVVEVAVPATAPLQREWVLVTHSPSHGVLVAGWEVPGQARTPDLDRRFETTWSVDPDTVLDAARLCVDLLRTYGVQTSAGADGAAGSAQRAALADRLDRRLDAQVAPARDPWEAISLFDRLLRYVDQG